MKGKEILVIDDDEDLQTLLKRILEGSGMIVHQALTIQEGARELKENAPHLVILDVNFTKGSGIDFLKAKKNNPQFEKIPVLMLSANSGKDTVFKAMSLGASDYFIKPVVTNKLIQKIRKVFKDYSAPSFRFKDNEHPEIRVHCKGELVKISEVSCILKAPLKITKKVDVEMSSPFLERIKADTCGLRTKRVGQSIGQGLYYNELSFVGMDESIAKRIRTVRTNKK